jgi:Zn-dependent protease
MGPATHRRWIASAICGPRLPRSVLVPAAVACGLALAAVIRGQAPLLHLCGVVAASAGCLLLALSLHEFAHGAAALRLGDTTARDEGRLTLNPIAHFDLFGLVIAPMAMLSLGLPMVGWAKPLPVSISRLRRPQRDMALVALAGPAANLAVAAAGAVALRAIGADGEHSLPASMAWAFVSLNLALAMFNMLPIYPMDGGRVAAALLPARAFRWLSRSGKREALAAVATAALLFGAPALAGTATGHDFSIPVMRTFNGVRTAVIGAPVDVWSKAFTDWADSGHQSGLAARP